MSGKGDKPRPIEDYEKFSSNWDAIFGKKPLKKEEPKKDDEVGQKDDHS